MNKIYVIENLNMKKIIDEINELEEKEEAHLIGSIMNYHKKNSIEVGDEEEGLVDLQPITMFYATIKEGKRGEDF